MADKLVNTRPENEIFDVEGENEGEEESEVEGGGRAPAPDEPEPDIEVEVDIGEGEPGAEPPAAAAPAAGDGQYGEKVNKRIASITGRHRQDMAEKDRQIARLKKDSFDAEGRALESSLSELTATKESLEVELKQAKEDGDTDKEVELQSKMVDTQVDIRGAENRKARAEAAGPPPAAGDKSADWYASLPAKTQEWMKRVGFADWSEDAVGNAQGIDAVLAREGFDLNSDDYFTELDRRLSVRYPELYPDPDGEPDPDPPPRPVVEDAPVRGGANPPAGQAPKKGATTKVTLGRADYANMRKFKLDPKNPAHVKAYATTKRQREAQERTA